MRSLLGYFFHSLLLLALGGVVVVIALFRFIFGAHCDDVEHTNWIGRNINIGLSGVDTLCVGNMRVAGMCVCVCRVLTKSRGICVVNVKQLCRGKW